MSTNTEEKIRLMERTPYVSTIGSLICGMLSTRSDICNMVEVMACFQSNLSPKYWKAVKHIMKYLKAIKNFVFCFDVGDLDIVRYTDSDF